MDDHPGDRRRIGRGELEADQRPDTRREHRCRSAAKVLDDVADVSGVYSDGGRLRGIVEPAAGVAAAVIGDDRAAGGELAGERVERVGVAGAAADQDQRRTAALRAVIDLRAGDQAAARDARSSRAGAATAGDQPRVALAEVADGAQQHRAAAAEDQNGHRGAGDDRDARKITPRDEAQDVGDAGKAARIRSNMRCPFGETM